MESRSIDRPGLVRAQPPPPDRAGWLAYAFIMGLIYPVGVPLLYYLLLRQKFRSTMDDFRDKEYRGHSKDEWNQSKWDLRYRGKRRYLQKQREAATTDEEREEFNVKLEELHREFIGANAEVDEDTPPSVLKEKKRLTSTHRIRTHSQSSHP